MTEPKRKQVFEIELEGDSDSISTPTRTVSNPLNNSLIKKDYSHLCSSLVQE